MMYTDGLKIFLARYFPTFMSTIFCGCISLGTSISLVGTTYFEGAPSIAEFTVFMALAMAAVLALSNFMMVRGRTWAVWIVVALFAMNLVVVLPTYTYRPHMFSYTTGLLFPLLGLLLLNSKRHREMREELVKIREERIKARNKGRKRK